MPPQVGLPAGLQMMSPMPALELNAQAAFVAQTPSVGLHGKLAQCVVIAGPFKCRFGRMAPSVSPWLDNFLYVAMASSKRSWLAKPHSLSLFLSFTVSLLRPTPSPSFILDGGYWNSNGWQELPVLSPVVMTDVLATAAAAAAATNLASYGLAMGLGGKFLIFLAG